MEISDVAVCQFTSKASSAGVVRAMLGFVPDFAILIQAHGATAPNVRLWVNNAKFSQWAATLTLLINGADGVISRNTSSLITAFSEASTAFVSTPFAAAETTDSDPKHVNQAGTAAAAGDVMRAGLAIAAAAQTASGANILLAFRTNR